MRVIMHAAIVMIQQACIAMPLLQGHALLSQTEFKRDVQTFTSVARLFAGQAMLALLSVAWLKLGSSCRVVKSHKPLHESPFRSPG